MTITSLHCSWETDCTIPSSSCSLCFWTHCPESSVYFRSWRPQDQLANCISKGSVNSTSETRLAKDLPCKSHILERSKNMDLTISNHNSRMRSILNCELSLSILQTLLIYEQDIVELTFPAIRPMQRERCSPRNVLIHQQRWCLKYKESHFNIFDFEGFNIEII